CGMYRGLPHEQAFIPAQRAGASKLGKRCRKLRVRVAPDAQATFWRRRRAKASRPPAAKIRPGRPAPAMGPGTDSPVSEKLALNGPWWVTSVPTLSQSGFKSSFRIQV